MRSFDWGISSEGSSRAKLVALILPSKCQGNQELWQHHASQITTAAECITFQRQIIDIFFWVFDWRLELIRNKNNIVSFNPSSVKHLWVCTLAKFGLQIHYVLTESIRPHQNEMIWEIWAQAQPIGRNFPDLTGVRLRQCSEQCTYLAAECGSLMMTGIAPRFADNFAAQS